MYLLTHCGLYQNTGRHLKYLPLHTHRKAYIFMMDLFMCSMLLLFVSRNMRCCKIYHERVDCGFYILSSISMHVMLLHPEDLFWMFTKGMIPYLQPHKYKIKEIVSRRLEPSVANCKNLGGSVCAPLWSVFEC